MQTYKSISFANTQYQNSKNFIKNDFSNGYLLNIPMLNKMSDSEIDTKELLKRIELLEARLDKFEKSEGKAKKKKPTVDLSSDEPVLYQEFDILKVDADYIIAVFSNPGEDMTTTQKFDSDQWDKLLTQLKAKENGDTLTVFDYSSGPLAMKDGELWKLH